MAQPIRSPLKLFTPSHSQTSYVLPDLIKCSRAHLDFSPPNPHEGNSSAASKAWIYSYDLLSGRQREFQSRTNVGLLAACCLPHIDGDRLRIACDFMGLLWMVDEISDDQDSAGVARTGEIMIKSLFDPSFFHDSELSRVCKDFYSRLAEYASPQHLKRVAMRCKETMKGAAMESEVRQLGRPLDLETYIPLRRLINGMEICFAFIEALLGLTLPREVYDNPALSRLREIANDLTWLGNDLYSYNMEQAKGHQFSNIMSSLVGSHGMDLQDAADYVGVQFNRELNNFVHKKTQLPSWGLKIDTQVACFVQALELWVTGLVGFSRNSEWYMSLEERESGIVTLRQPEAEVLRANL